MSTLVYPAANNTIELHIDDRSRQDGGTAARRHIGADIVELLRLPLVRLLPRGTHRQESLPEQQDPVTHTRASVFQIGQVTEGINRRVRNGLERIHRPLLRSKRLRPTLRRRLRR